MSDFSKPLDGNPARQAVHSLLGYDYQIWRSLEAWLSLGEAETLFLECAEDYDIVAPDGGITVQVKNSPADISLGMEEIRTSIDGFWDVAAKNANRGTVSLRYLTRGGVAMERGSPFSPHKGIDLWAVAAAGDLDACSRLAAYLRSKALSTSLLTFLNEASPEQLHAKLFSRVEWVFGEPSAAVVRLGVERLAIKRGAEEDISAVAAVAAVDALLARCREAATRAEPALRCLTREDMALHFSRATSVSVPMTSVALQALSKAMMAGVAGTTGPEFAIAPSLFEFEPPELPQTPLPRAGFARTVASGLTRDGAVLIVGSEGRGKTTIANVVSRAFNAPCVWLDLAKLDDAEIVAKLRLGLSLVRRRASDEPLCVVLDDLPVVSGMSQSIWSPLSALVRECRGGSRRLLATAKGVEADAVDERIRTAGIPVIAVPDLSREEIEAYFKSLGCNDESDAAGWAAFALKETGGGHPKLVYLLGLELRDQGWPIASNSSAADGPRSLEQARARARRVAADTVPEVDRPLLYALSAAAIGFDRHVAVWIGDALGLDFPGESFSRLHGRWIESRGRDRFAVTSLLAGSAEKVWTGSRLEEIHRHLFDAFLSRSYVRIDEAVGILSHALCGRDAVRLSNFLGKLTIEEVDTVPGLMEQLDPVLKIVDLQQVPAVAFDPKSSVLLRMLQFRVAKSRQPSLMEEVATAWQSEIGLLANGKFRDGCRLIRAFSIAAVSDGVLSGRTVVSAVADIASLEGVFSEPPAELLLSSGRVGADDRLDLIAELFSAAQLRCSGVSYLREFLAELDATSPSVRGRLLRDIGLPRKHPTLNVFERAWLVESRSGHPDWAGLLIEFGRGVEMAALWDAPLLPIGAAKVISIVQDEELDEPERALDSLRKAQQRFGPSSILREQEANVLFRRERHSEALAIWRAVYSDPARVEMPGHDHYSCRKAAIAASNASLFKEAAGWLERGADFVGARAILAGPVRESYLIDAAHCWFRANRGDRTVELLARALGSTPSEVVCSDDRRAFMNLKSAGHVIFWMLGFLTSAPSNGNNKLDEPLVGQCSIAEVSDELAGLPATSWHRAAAGLMRLDVLLGTGNLAIAQMRPHLEANGDLVAETTYRTARMEEEFRADSLDSIAKCAMSLQVQVWRCEAQSRVGWDATRPFDEPVTQVDRLTSMPHAEMLLSALMIAALRGQSVLALRKSWMADASRSGAPEAVVVASAIEKACSAFFLNAGAAPTRFMSEESSHVERLGAAAAILAGPTAPPSVTAICQMAALSWIAQSGALGIESIVQSLAPPFAHMWQLHLESPEQLMNPLVAIPALRSSIKLAEASPGMLTSLFDAAMLATDDQVPAALRTFLGRVEASLTARGQAMADARGDKA